MEIPVDIEAVGNSYTDKVVLPQRILEQLVQSIPEDQLPHPLIFRCCHSQVHLSVREFSARECAEVPQHLADRIGRSHEVLQLVEPPKATQVKLRPHHRYDIYNYKFFLEAALPKYYTTLTTGQVIVIEQSGLKYELTVEEIDRSTDVKTRLIVDTDVDLEINDGGVVAEAPQPTEVELPVKILAEVGAPVYDPTFKPAVYRFASPGRVLVRVHGGDVVASTDEFVSMQAFKWTTMALEDSSGWKQLEVDEPGTVYLVPFIWLERPMEVAIELAEPENGRKPSDSGSAAGPDTVVCSNCHRPIPRGSYLLHEVQCRRLNVLCPGCGASYPRNTPHFHCTICQIALVDPQFETRHHKLFHEPLYTCGCQFHAQNYVELAHHRAADCPLRLHVCQFCHLAVPVGELTYQDRYLGILHHENECGNKTTECFQCGKVVRVKDVATHVKHHELNKQQSQVAGFTRCLNLLCINRAGGTMGLCDHCFGPLYLTQHDPDGAKLRNRIERRYVLQLSKGCGRAQCLNEYCKTGQPFSDNMATFKKVLLPMVPSEFHFCVDELMDNKRAVVEAYIAEAKYKPEMILEGASRGGDLGQWLAKNAVAAN